VSESANDMPSAITPEMIEAAAIAIRNEVADKAGRGRVWNALPPKLRDQYRAEASVALHAALAVHPTAH